MRPSGHDPLPGHAFRQVLEAIGYAAVVVDLAGLVVYWNDEAEHLYGWSADEAAGRPIDELILPADQPALLVDSAWQALLEGLRFDGDWEVRHRDGRRFTVRCSSSRVVDDGGVPIAVACLAHDVSAVRSSREEVLRLADSLALVERRWRARFETPGLAQLVCDPSGRVLQANDAACALLERERADVVGRMTADLHHPGDLHAGQQLVGRADADGASWERVFALPDGSPLPLLVTLGVVPDADGEPESTIAVLQDLRRVHRLEEAAREAALEQQRLRLHDPLTGLGNRKLLEARLATDAARALRDGHPVAVLVVALDGFSLVNDACGHAVGDRLLQVTAGRLAELVGPADTLVRVGGDVFAVLAPGLDPGQARGLAERLRVAVGRPAAVEDAQVRVAASVGLATAGPYEDWSLLLRDADTAVREAKNRGRDRVEVFAPELARAASARLRLLSDLRTVLDTGAELRLDYQPQVELATGRVVGVEALARWAHPELGELSPLQFVPLAVEHGLAGQLDVWAVRRAVGELPAVRAALGQDVSVSVNITTSSLTSGCIVDVVEELEVPRGALVLELTEHLLLLDPAQARAAIGRLEALGVAVSVDDFGTGASTLQSVVELPVHELKIDRSFVSALARDRGAHAVAASIAALARALGLRVVAEGVETEAQARALDRLGVPVGQGWLYAKATPLDRLGEPLGVATDVPSATAAASRGASWFPAEDVGDEHGLFLLLRLHDEGLSSTSIAAALNAAGWRTPLLARWHRTTVGRMVRELGDPPVAEAQSTR